MRGAPSRRRRRAREGAHPSMRDRARAGDDARIGRIRAQDASLFRRPRAQATSAPEMRVRFGGFGVNPLTWCAWAMAGIAAALMERNPYLQLLLLAILLTVWIAARHHRSMGYWRAALVLGLLPILFSLVFSRYGSHVLFHLPSHLPVIGGAWTVEAPLYAASTR